MPEPIETELPLKSRTPDAWAVAALAEPIALLSDHAHLEKKAAANAMELLLRWPQSDPPENWAAAMTSIAKDEADHLSLVTKLLYRRGGRMTKHHANPYANALRDLVRRGTPNDLVDRLLVSALIELRSCERFEALSRNCADEELKKLYGDLWASERGHYLTFLKLAAGVQPAETVSARWQELLTEEAGILAEQSPGPRIHSGYVG